MEQQALKDLQAPLKLQYQSDPLAAKARMHAFGDVDFETLTCRLPQPAGHDGMIIAGLHPKAGGSNTQACSADMLLQALVSCGGVTMAAVATSMGLDIQSARIEAVGVMDFRGTLGVDRSVPVGMTSIELIYHIHSNCNTEQLDKMIQLVERYCVVLQTLKSSVPFTSRRAH